MASVEEPKPHLLVDCGPTRTVNSLVYQLLNFNHSLPIFSFLLHCWRVAWYKCIAILEVTVWSFLQCIAKPEQRPLLDLHRGPARTIHIVFYLLLTVLVVGCRESIAMLIMIIKKNRTYVRAGKRPLRETNLSAVFNNSRMNIAQGSRKKSDSV